MPYFAMQVWTANEGRFVAIAGKRTLPEPARLIWPRRSLRIRKGGTWRNSLAPVFPGYVFVQADTVDPILYGSLSQVPGFIRFLPADDSITPLEKRDQELLSHFLSFGEIVSKSLVYFDENRRIRVVSGPLRGLEGRIVKVDRRKGRAKVRLEMYKDSFAIDFGFEALESAPEPERAVQV